MRAGVSGEIQPLCPFGMWPRSFCQYVVNVLSRIRSVAKLQICSTSRCFEPDLQSIRSLAPAHASTALCLLAHGASVKNQHLRGHLWPPPQHVVQFALQAVEAGKAALSEKPIADTVALAHDAIARYRALPAPPPWVVGENWRFLPVLTDAAAVVGGRMGRVYKVDLACDIPFTKNATCAPPFSRIHEFASSSDSVHVRKTFGPMLLVALPAVCRVQYHAIAWDMIISSRAFPPPGLSHNVGAGSCAT